MHGLRLILLGLLVLPPAGVPAFADVVINEIMYNSPGTPDVEYVELFNRGSATVDLTGWYLLDDDNAHDRCFLAGTLEAGEYLVVVGSLVEFGQSYPSVTNINANAFNGENGAGFGLGNTLDRVRLFDSSETLIDDVAYLDSSPWPIPADGDGASLELINPVLDNDLATSWAASLAGGTPGVVNSMFLDDPPPLVGSIQRNIPLPKSFQNVAITVEITDDQPLSVVDLFVDTGSGFAPLAMTDDGLSGDGAAGDGTWGAIIGPQPSSTLVRYYVSATDTLPQTTVEPSSAPAAFLAYTVDYEPPSLTINEILASNQSGAVDTVGEREDWLEIRNGSSFAVNVGGMFLTDDLDVTTRWQLPSTVIPPGGYLLIWCDGELGDGPLHAAFKLAKEGGEVGLFDSASHGNVRLDGYTFGLQNPDISFGYHPDDADRPDYLTPASPAVSNDNASIFSFVCINEVLASSGQPDFIELHNRGPLTTNISGWLLTDDLTIPGRFPIPASTSLAPGAFISFDQSQLGFGLDDAGSDIVMLTHADGVTGRDYLDLDPQGPGSSLGRFPDGGGDWHVLDPASPGLPNACNPAIPALSPVQEVRFLSPEVLAWDALSGAPGYDVTQGDLGLLQSSGGDFSSAVTNCPQNNRGDLSAWIAQAPGLGAAQFFLVRGVDFACGFGTYESGAASQAGTRDSEILTSQDSCP